MEQTNYFPLEKGKIYWITQGIFNPFPKIALTFLYSKNGRAYFMQDNQPLLRLGTLKKRSYPYVSFFDEKRKKPAFGLKLTNAFYAFYDLNLILAPNQTTEPKLSPSEQDKAASEIAHLFKERGLI